MQSLPQVLQIRLLAMNLPTYIIFTTLCLFLPRSVMGMPSVVNSSSAAPASSLLPWDSTAPNALTDTVADLLAISDIEDPDSSSPELPTTSTDPVAKRRIASVPSPVSFEGKLSRRKTINAFYNSTTHGGYNLSIPGCLSGSTILGNIEAPNGSIIRNATFADLIRSLQLPGDVLQNYTLTQLTRTITAINTTITRTICPLSASDSASRSLLWWPGSLRPQYRNVEAAEGFVSAFLVGLGGFTAIGYTGMQLAIVHEGITANISLNTEVAILVGTGALQYIFLTMLWRLQSVPKRWIGRAEALVLNAFIWMGERALACLEGETCVPSGSAERGLSSLIGRARNQVQVLRFGNYRLGGSLAGSAMSLIGLAGGEDSPTDLEVGAAAAAAAMRDAGSRGIEEAVQVGLEVADQAVRLQIDGGSGPGSSCG
ncbi:hypothetical protein MMC21_008177 [Puttea exsequens]|nr:hypothetical protein [Puttea exsequens]